MLDGEQFCGEALNSCGEFNQRAHIREGSSQATIDFIAQLKATIQLHKRVLRKSRRHCVGHASDD